MKGAYHPRTRITFLGVVASLGRGIASGVEDVNEAPGKTQKQHAGKRLTQ